MNSSDRITQSLNIATLGRFSENVGDLLIFREKVLDLRPKSVCAVEITMYIWSSGVYIKGLEHNLKLKFSI